MDDFIFSMLGGVFSVAFFFQGVRGTLIIGGGDKFRKEDGRGEIYFDLMNFWRKSSRLRFNGGRTLDIEWARLLKVPFL